MSIQEFNEMYEKWIKKIIQPKSAFVIVDVQNDFISGSLAIKNCAAKQDGEDVSSSTQHAWAQVTLVMIQVVAPINLLLDTVPFSKCYYSLDWHPADHVSFIDNVQMRPLVPGTAQPALYATVTFEGPPRMEQVLWPRHCVQESWGAELHKGEYK